MDRRATSDPSRRSREWKHFAAGVAALGLGASLVFATTTVAGTPTTEILTLQQSDHTWTSVGGIVDAGSWATYRRALGGLPSPVAGAFTLFITLTGSAGTIDLRLFVQVTPTGERDLCTVTAGTGAYSTLAGQGTWAQAGSGTEAVLTCTLQVNAG